MQRQPFANDVGDSMITYSNRWLATLVLVLAVLACPCLAQDAAPAGGDASAAPAPAAAPAADQKLSKLWGDLLHYIKIARPDMAKSFGQAILDSGASAREVYLLSVTTPSAQVDLARGENLEGMKDVIVAIRKLIEKGYEAERSDPAQIAASIESLGGTVRGYELAARRLEVSGEFALPQLLQKLTDPQTSDTLRGRIINVLPRLGKDAVRPLAEALQTSDPKLQEVLANALGSIGYPHSAAQLRELSVRAGTLDRVARASQRALAAVAGAQSADKPVAELAYDLAQKYYADAESVQADIRYDTANVWYWTEGLGLTYKAVPRAIFNEIYAMRMARLALKHDANFYPAVSLWVAANLKRQAQLPAGATDATQADQEPTPQFYALASGAKYLQDVLARAMKDKDSAVALGAIEALAKSSGAKSLIEPLAGGAQPLVQALSYPDRQVRFLAAESLARALPDKRFTGQDQVMSVLNEALRQTGQKAAIVVAADDVERNKLKDAVRGAGFEVVEGATMADGVAAARKTAGVDVAVVGVTPELSGALAALRKDAYFAALPVVALQQSEVARKVCQSDGYVVLANRDAPAADLVKAIDDALKQGVGTAMSPEQAGEWAVRAAQAVELLGLTGNSVLDVCIARASLIAALNDSRESVKLAVAKALGTLNAADAQQALAAQAVKADLAENVRIAALNDLSASLRRFGNLLTEKLAQEVLAVVTGKGSQELRNAAAQALGAMSLPSDQIKSLIIETGANR